MTNQNNQIKKKVEPKTNWEEEFDELFNSALLMIDHLEEHTDEEHMKMGIKMRGVTPLIKAFIAKIEKEAYEEGRGRNVFKNFDCDWSNDSDVQNSCGECEVCEYLDFLDFAGSVAPPGSTIERNKRVEHYLELREYLETNNDQEQTNDN